MTTVQFVKKHRGEQETFQQDKLERSIEQTLLDCGMRPKEWNRAHRITGNIITRLNQAYDGTTVPTTDDIREMVVATLIDNNLAFVARKYIGFRQKLNVAHRTTPTYGNGIAMSRYFTKAGVHPFEELKWERRTAVIKSEKGDVIFEQRDVEVPVDWSQTATNIVVSKYFKGKIGDVERETSARELISRVADTIAMWGRNDGYFATEADADTFQAELTHILINQKAAFNSPVWFNVGINPRPQCSACFINSVEDDMRSIMSLATTESMLFKYGSGTGSNLSKLRGSCEYLSLSNGRSSGVVSFMKGWDAFAGIVKSGGKTRRAAKMVILNVDHPDIVEFIQCKMKEEKKAWALIDAGYDGSFTGEAYTTISFQNANNSVRVTDEFMRAVENDGEWNTVERTTKKVAHTYRARDVMRKMAESAWWCGDPGIQYDTTTNRWNTSKATGPINASNPCSEYVYLDDTACNLSSLNVLKFRKGQQNERFDVEAFKHAAEVMITAMEILVGNSSYPTPSIEQNSLDYRPLGIGYANLGALLMSRGLPYDSDEGRNLAAAITSLMSGWTYRQSAKIAEKVGPFNGFAMNRESAIEVMNMHRDASYAIPKVGVPEDLWQAAAQSWDDTVALASRHGLRNGQISVLAPTGTISFLMDCATTGIEPDIALVKYKWMVDGGMEKLVNGTVPEALNFLGYTESEARVILDHIVKTDTIEGAPHIKEEHLPVFDCAFKAKNGTRTIHYMGHVYMRAAVQPFLSGAISKTVNMPKQATMEEIERVYMEGWKLGLKAIAIYRDGSKRQQPLTTSIEQKQKGQKAAEAEGETVPVPASAPSTIVNAPRRRRLPDERASITHKFAIGSHKGYITVGLYDDGTPGEMFITMNKEGSVISGLMNALAATTSIALQYGVPLKALVNKFAHMRFEPSGFTSNPNIKIAKSIVDYVFRWMGMKFLASDAQYQLGINRNGQETIHDVNEASKSAVVGDSQTTLFDGAHAQAMTTPSSMATPTHTATFDNQSDAPACETCGAMMVRNAACYKCLNCGATSGCS